MSRKYDDIPEFDRSILFQISSIRKIMSKIKNVEDKEIAIDVVIDDLDHLIEYIIGDDPILLEYYNKICPQVKS